MTRPTTLEEWLGRNSTRHWDSESSTHTFAACKPSLAWKIRLKSGAMTVSVGTGPSKQIAIEDSLVNLPQNWW